MAPRGASHSAGRPSPRAAAHPAPHPATHSCWPSILRTAQPTQQPPPPGAQNYQEALRVAEERERTLKDAFERFDFDGSGSMDMEEILGGFEAAQAGDGEAA